MNETIQFTVPLKIFGHTETMVILGRHYSYSHDGGTHIVLKKSDAPSRQMRIPVAVCVFSEGVEEVKAEPKKKSAA